MAHDRMNDDLDRNMGRAGQEDDLGSGQDFGKGTPGRNPGQGQQTGQKGAGQKNNPLEDDDFGGSESNKFGGGQSGQSGQGAHGGRMGGQNQ